MMFPSQLIVSVFKEVSCIMAAIVKKFVRIITIPRFRELGKLKHIEILESFRRPKKYCVTNKDLPSKSFILQF